MDRFGYESQVDNGSDQIANGVTCIMETGLHQRTNEIRKARLTLLQETGDQSSSVWGHILQSGIGSLTPNSSHGDTKHRPDSQESAVVCAEGRRELEDRD